MAKHFLKTLILFTGMIILGLIGVYLVTQLDKDDKATNVLDSNTLIVK
jgi:hypothetical protein